MYIDKETKRGYNEYLNMNHNEGEQTFMDVGLLILEAGDHYGINEPEKRLPYISLQERSRSPLETRKNGSTDRTHLTLHPTVYSCQEAFQRPSQPTGQVNSIFRKQKMTATTNPSSTHLRRFTPGQEEWTN